MRNVRKKYIFFIWLCLVCLLAPSTSLSATKDTKEDTKNFTYSEIEIMQDYKIGAQADLLNYKLHQQTDVYSPMPHSGIDLDLRWSDDSVRDLCLERKYCNNRAMNEETRRSQLFRNNRVNKLDDKLNPDLELQFSIPITEK